MGLDMFLTDGSGDEVGYWRKANQIHKWFVTNVQGGVDECQKSPVTREQLKTLLETVKKVQAKEVEPDVALSTQSGFFFGSTNYDDGYFQDLADTVEIIEKALATDTPEFIYHSSW